MTRSHPPLVALLTEDRFCVNRTNDWYLQQILEEDRLLEQATGREGMACRRVAWSDPRFDWTGAAIAMFRTTWDYSTRFTEFSDWIDRASKATKLVNAPEIIRWNLDKRYLFELQTAGIRIPSSECYSRGSRIDLAEVMARNNWAEVIVKPTVSGGARNTFRIPAADASRTSAMLNRILGMEAMLVQEFQSSILTEGELSVIVIGGRFTHAVRKVAKPGDFRVQDDHGGTVHPHAATSEEKTFAEQAIAACPSQPVYARVDVMRDNTGQLTLMELELIEPELFLRFHPPAAETLARELRNCLGGASSQL